MDQAPVRTAGRGADGDDDLAALFLRYHRTGDERARDRLIAHHLPFARSLATRMYRRGEPLDDLVQVAYEHLVKALDRFDPERGIPFEGYAGPTITGALKRHFRDQGWGMRVPRPVHELAPRLTSGVDALSQELGRSPTAQEVADRLDLPPAELDAVRQAVHARQLQSLDAPLLGTTTMPGEGQGSADPGYLQVEDHLDLRDALDLLDPQEIGVLREYYVEERSQATIADDLGVSQMQVSRRLSRITAKLRDTMLPS